MTEQNLPQVTDWPGTREEFAAWLDAIPPIPRARLLRLMVDAEYGLGPAELAARRRAAIAEARTTMSGAEVAEQLHVSVHAVHKAVKEHNKARRAGERQEDVVPTPS